MSPALPHSFHGNESSKLVKGDEKRKNYTIFTALQPKEAVDKGPLCSNSGMDRTRIHFGFGFFAFLNSSWKTTVF